MANKNKQHFHTGNRKDYEEQFVPGERKIEQTKKQGSEFRDFLTRRDYAIDTARVVKSRRLGDDMGIQALSSKFEPARDIGFGSPGRQVCDSEGYPFIIHATPTPQRPPERVGITMRQVMLELVGKESDDDVRELAERMAYWARLQLFSCLCGIFTYDEGYEPTEKDRDNEHRAVGDVVRMCGEFIEAGRALAPDSIVRNPGLNSWDGLTGRAVIGRVIKFTRFSSAAALNIYVRFCDAVYMHAEHCSDSRMVDWIQFEATARMMAFEAGLKTAPGDYEMISSIAELNWLFDANINCPEHRQLRDSLREFVSSLRPQIPSEFTVLTSLMRSLLSTKNMNARAKKLTGRMKVDNADSIWQAIRATIQQDATMLIPIVVAVHEQIRAVSSAIITKPVKQIGIDRDPTEAERWSMRRELLDMLTRFTTMVAKVMPYDDILPVSLEDGHNRVKAGVDPMKFHHGRASIMRKLRREQEIEAHHEDRRQSIGKALGNQFSEAKDQDGIINIRDGNRGGGWWSFVDAYHDDLVAGKIQRGTPFSTWVADKQQRLKQDEDFQAMMSRQGRNDVVDHIQFQNKCVYVEHAKRMQEYGSPYFKIEPRMCMEFLQTEAIMFGHELRFPFPSFNIIFKQDCNFIDRSVSRVISREQGDQVNCELAAIGVSVFDIHRAEKPTKHSYIIAGGRKLVGAAAADCNRALHMTSQYRMMLPGEHKHRWFNAAYSIYLRDNEPVEQAWFSRHAETREQEMTEFDLAVWRIVCTTAMFGVDNHERLFPDIPRKHRVKYMKAKKDDDSKTKKEIEAKAKQLGLGGFIIREIELPTDELEYVDRNPSEETGEGAPLNHSHYRRPHWRRQRCGEGRKDVKHIYIEGTRVRPDLPLKPLHGFAIRDELLRRREEFRKEHRLNDDGETNGDESAGQA